jgi:hypothetical protein
MSIDADKGFNEVVYDVSFSDKGRKTYVKANKEPTISKAKNGVYYLPKGTYTVHIEEASSMFEVK